MLLLLKLTLAPLLVAAATLVARRWGPRVGGLFVGPAADDGADLPVPRPRPGARLRRAGDGGHPVRAGRARGLRPGLCGRVAEDRLGRIPRARGGGLLRRLAAIGWLGVGIVEAGLAAWAALALAAALIRRPGPGVARAPPPWWDLPVRMLAARNTRGPSGRPPGRRDRLPAAHQSAGQWPAVADGLQRGRRYDLPYPASTNRRLPCDGNRRLRIIREPAASFVWVAPPAALRPDAGDRRPCR